MATGPSELERKTMRAIMWRIMPVMGFAYFIASLDRVNVGFAAFQMNADVHLSPADFGFGASIFFVSYCIFSVPGSMAVAWLGAQRDLMVVLLSWGLASAATALIAGPFSFFVVRFLLGMAEAAFFPAVILYLAHWLPKAHRSRLLSLLMIGLPLASVFGSPLSALLLGTDGWLGFRGWHWLFVIEALPAVLLGLLTPVVLPASIKRVSWLDPAQKVWISDTLAQERNSVPARARPFWRVMLDRRVLALTMINVGAVSVTNGLAIWQPQILRSFHLTDLQVGFINSIPFAIAVAVMYAWAWHSDRTGERRIHTALPLAVGICALLLTLVASSLASVLTILCIAISAASMIKGPFWALATEAVEPEDAAVSFGQVTSLTNIGAFAGTYGIGFVSSATGSYAYAMLPLALILVLAFLCAVLFPSTERMKSPVIAKTAKV